MNDPVPLDQKDLEYKAILDHAGVAVVFTRARRVYRCNRTAEELFGWPTGGLIGLPGRVFYPDDESYAEIGRRAAATLAEGGTVELESPMARRDGSVFSARVIARAIDPGSPEPGTIWIAHDISAEVAAREIQARLLREQSLIFERALTGMIFVRDRIIERCNPRFAEIMGYATHELIGQSTRVFYESDDDWIDIGERGYQAVRATGRFETESTYRRRDGTLIWCRVTGNMIDPADPGQGYLWLYEDITERRQAVAALNELLREQTLIFERAQIGILFVRDRVIVRCNRRFEEIFGFGRDALIGQSTRVLFSDDETWTRTSSEVYAELHSEGIFDGDVKYHRKDGTPIVCHVIGRLLDAAEPESGFVWLFEDITERRTAEDALLRSYAEQKLIFDNATIGISYVRDRVFLRCNRRLEEIFGFPPGSMVGKSTRILFASDAEYETLGRRIYADGIAAGGFNDEIVYHRHDDGRPITVFIRGRQLDLGDGIVWIWTYEDITARRAAEDALRRSNREYALIFENAMIGISYMRDRIFLRCNRRLEEIFGFSPGALVGRSSRELFESDEDWEETGRRVYDETLPDHGFAGEIRYRRQDGQPIWVRASGRPIREGDDTIWIWTHQDVTRRHLAEQALLTSHGELEKRVAERTDELLQQVHLLRQLIEAIPGPVYYKDADGRYMGCNSAFGNFVGHPPAAIVGRTPRDIAPGELADQDIAADRELVERTGAQVYEAEVRHASGDLRNVMFHKATFNRPDGTVAGLVGVMLDITDRKRMEESLQQAATVFDSSAEGVVITAPEGTIIAVNRAFTEITGYGEDEVIGRNPRLLQSGRQGPDFYRQMWETLTAAGRWQGEVWNRRKDGRIYPEWLTISAVRDRSGTVRHYVGVFSDITAIKKAHDQLDYQAHHDPLTGLPNRLLLEDRLSTALQRARREQTGLAVLFVDLDRFKNINDTLGHDVGDQVLCEVARRFGALVRESDTVARLGGDEFLIVIEAIQEPASASRIADKILDDLRAKAVTVGQEFFVGASIGISLFPQDGDDSAALMKNADIAMYRAKERGRNTYEFFTKDLTSFSLERFQMETALRHAIERDELFIMLQPQFSLADGALVGAEALVRWQHPVQGMITPAKFIPLAEESGLIVAVGDWVRRMACRQWATWIAAGLSPGVLSVNVSGVEFRRGDLERSVAEVLAGTRLPPAALELEITESAMMSQAESSIQFLHDLRAMGLSLAIDDFGTGYSSLAYLKRLPLNKLKVDQSFVRGLTTDADDCAIARAVIALGHSLQLKVIAEGVETVAQAEFLAREGCDEMQGFLRGRPVSCGEFERLHLRAGG